MSLTSQKIRGIIFSKRDAEYGRFSSSLMPTVKSERVIGVRIPELRKIAKSIKDEEEGEAFLHDLPHEYFEENNIHAFLINDIKDFDRCIRELDLFLPYVDNWATCDSIRPKCFKHEKEKLLTKIKEWLESAHLYTVRFGIEMLMVHYLDGDFSTDHAEAVARIEREEYYVKMMVAWYFSTALSKQWEGVIPIIENNVLPPWTHNKAIQKAIESYRITDAQKKYLRSLKRK